MKIPRYAGGRARGVNMTPMIDVVFLLIIFFLVSSHLARREHELPLELPTAATGDEVPVEAARLTLNIENDGTMSLGGSRISAEDLRQRLLAARQKQGDDVELRVRADRTVPYRVIRPVLATAAQCGLWNVTFAVIRPPV